MEPLIIEPNSVTPRIIFNPGINQFEISEKSLPEDALAFYLPVIEWIKEYGNNPNPETIIEFKLEYFNTASSRMFYKIFMMLKEISDQTALHVKWFYKAEDTDMLASGKRFEKLIDIQFDLIEY